MAGIGLSVFAGLFLIIMAVAVSSFDNSPAIENLQNKVTSLESENDKLKNDNVDQNSEIGISKLEEQNKQLQNKITSIENPENDIKSDIVFDNSDLEELKQHFDDVQSLPKAILKECNSVNSYQDYVVFAMSIATAEKIGFEGQSMTEVVEDINMSLTLLEISEWGENPQVKQLIKDTRSLYGETGTCIEKVAEKYE